MVMSAAIVVPAPPPAPPAVTPAGADLLAQLAALPLPGRLQLADALAALALPRGDDGVDWRRHIDPPATPRAAASFRGATPPPAAAKLLADPAYLARRVAYGDLALDGARAAWPWLDAERVAAAILWADQAGVLT